MSHIIHQLNDIQRNLDKLIELVDSSQPYYKNNDVNHIVTLTAIDYGYFSWPFLPLVAVYSANQIYQETKRQKQIRDLISIFRNYLNDPDLDHSIKTKIINQLHTLNIS